MTNLNTKKWALCLALILANLGTLFVPGLLESQDLGIGVFFESDHDPNLCSTGHDHSICLQYSSGKLFITSVLYGLDDGHSSTIEYADPYSRPFSVQSVKGHRDRAPPIS